MEEVIEALRSALGADAVLTGDEIAERYKHDWRGETSFTPRALMRPRSTDDVATILRICHEHGQPVVPQSGMTGLCGGATPRAEDVALSLERMSGVEEIDAAASTLTALAGTPLQTIQEAAQAAGFLCALDLGARGSCLIGGNVSTNAGGNRVLRYGMARDLVLGIEVVLADGTVLRSLNKMIKNNAGYDLKQLFIGSEGTLGIVTRVVLRLHPLPRSTCTALCAVRDYDRVVRLLRHAQNQLAGTLSAFEAMWPEYYDLVTTRFPGNTAPLAAGHGLYVLLEALGVDQDADQSRFEAVLASALENGIIEDASIAQSQRQAASFWKLRDSIADAQQHWSPNTGFDVSIPIGQLGIFVDACRAAIATRFPGAEQIFFGHVADSNVHVVVHMPGADAARFPKREIDRTIYELVRERQGCVSAEHGIGTRKKAYLAYSRSADEIRLMQIIKQALDPKGILNAGKVLPDPDTEGSIVKC